MDTKEIARLKAKTKQRIKDIMDAAREREAAHLVLSQSVPDKKAHYLGLAEEEIRSAKSECDQLTLRIERIQDRKSQRKLKKLLGE